MNQESFISRQDRRVRLNVHFCRNSGGMFPEFCGTFAEFWRKKGKVHTSTVHVCPALRTGQTCTVKRALLPEFWRNVCRNSANVSGVLAEKRKSPHIDGACLSRSDHLP
eukprot:1664335-Amphidinium_carterae.1